MPQKIENSSDFVEFAHDVMLRFKDKDEGKRLLEKAEENVESRRERARNSTSP